jgi:hypothetical protein
MGDSGYCYFGGAEMKWKPVDDDTPKDRTILGCYKIDNGYGMLPVCFDHGRKLWMFTILESFPDGYNRPFRYASYPLPITHWQKMPEPPESGAV